MAHEVAIPQALTKLAWPLRALPIIVWVLVSGTSAAQPAVRSDLRYDTTYVRDLSLAPTLRGYAVHKFNGFAVGTARNGALELRPNRNFNLGVGISYRRLTLNLGFRLPFLNNDDADRGRSRTLDAQANVFGVQRVTNIFLQISRGYYMPSFSPDALGWQQPTTHAYRADLRQFNIGLSTLRIVGAERFSYRAAFNQDAWQLRSAGTWLYGGYATLYVLSADSAIVPRRLRDPDADETRFSRGTFVDAGLMGGRAHTWVHREHWFVSVSGALGAGPSVRSLSDSAGNRLDHLSTIGLGWRVQGRISLGWSGARHFIGVLASQESAWLGLRRVERFTFDVGNVRLVYAYHLRQRQRHLDRGLRWLRKRTPMGNDIVPDER